MNYFPDNRGVTLLEVMLAIGISILFMTGITGIMIFSFRSNKIVWEQLYTQNEGRRVTRDFSRELRSAAASSVGGYPLVEASSTEIIFYSNIDSDSARERVRYFLDGVTLKKGVLKPSGNPLTYNPANEIISEAAHDVANGANPVFRYYGENFSGSENPLSSPVDVAAVRVVSFYLQLEEDPRASPAPFNIETKVNIRNLKNN